MEYEQMLVENIKTYLDDSGRVKTFPSKRRPKLYILCYLATKFEEGKAYTEAEINLELLNWHTFNDSATLRREMYDFTLLNRKNDGKEYMLNPNRLTIFELLDKYCK